MTPGLDENLSITNAQGVINYYTQDGLGSVRTLTNASGALVNKSDYTAFGEKYAANTVEGIANRYGYTGRENSYVASAGAPMFYRNRMYSPQVGRFLRVDPAGYPNNVDGNLYAYCSNSVLGLTDPYGQGFWSVAAHFAAGVVVGAVIAAAVVVAAPVAVAALVAVGVSTVAASAVVTTAVGVAGAVGVVATGINTYNNIKSGDYDSAAFGVGTLVGGIAVGAAGGGRALSRLGGEESSVPKSWNPFADSHLGYDPSYPGGSITGWLGSAPTPSSGGLSAAGAGSLIPAVADEVSHCGR